MSTFNFDHGDDLSDMLGGEPQAAPRVLPQAPELARVRATVEAQPMERCPRCAGTGMTRWGTCFKCNGKAVIKGFKTPLATRVANRAKVQDRKVAQANNRVEHFAGKGEQQAAMVAWMNAKRDSFGFAGAMLEAVQKYGDLTPGQEAAVLKCLARDQERVAQKAAVAQQTAAVSFANLRAAFDVVVSRGAKKAQMTVGDVNVSLASLSGRNPGALYVKFQGEYAGKIVGTTFQGRNASPELMAALALIEADPTAAIKNDAARRAELLASGAVDSMPCGCCGLTLTDPVSIARGIGPICAGKWGF